MNASRARPRPGSEGAVEVLSLRTSNSSAVIASAPAPEPQICLPGKRRRNRHCPYCEKAMREMVGTASLKICSRLAPTSGPRMVFPVTLPPGRAMLATVSSHQGSPIAIMTIGMVAVASLAARVGGVP